MADNGASTSHSHDFQVHKSTYEGFLKASIALTILCLYVLVSLVAFAFVASGNVLLGFAGLIIGIVALVIDVRAGNKWSLSVGWLVIFGLLTAVMVS